MILVKDTGLTRPQVRGMTEREVWEWLTINDEDNRIKQKKAKEAQRQAEREAG